MSRIFFLLPSSKTQYVYTMVGGVESNRGVDGCLRAFSARSQNIILTF
jgi:hypothetical protein